MAKTDHIAEFLTRGVDSIYPTRAALEKRLKNGQQLSLYLGIDPTGAELHLGHLVVLQKLRQAQQLGAKVILLFGDFTAQTGDPTDKQAVRQPMTKEAAVANAKRYKEQAARVLDFDGPNPVEIKFNSEWLSKLTFTEVAELAGHFTVQQMLERDMFEGRLKAGKPISLREFLYPLMQGYDSVNLEVDLELGATDQTFNMLAGRKLAKEYLGKEKFVLTTPLLADASGVKIGKSEGNVIAIAGDPADLYGHIMTLPDEVIVNALEWCTSVPADEVADVAKLAKSNPRDAKMRLAHAIVAEVNDFATANRAEAEFVRVVQNKELETNRIREWKPTQSTYQDSRRALVEAKLASSLSEANRKFEEGAVRLNGEVLKGATIQRAFSPGSILSVGKKPQNRVKVV